MGGRGRKRKRPVIIPRQSLTSKKTHVDPLKPTLPLPPKKFHRCGSCKMVFGFGQFDRDKHEEDCLILYPHEGEKPKCSFCKTEFIRSDQTDAQLARNRHENFHCKTLKSIAAISLSDTEFSCSDNEVEPEENAANKTVDTAVLSIESDCECTMDLQVSSDDPTPGPSRTSQSVTGTSSRTVQKRINRTDRIRDLTVKAVDEVKAKADKSKRPPGILSVTNFYTRPKTVDEPNQPGDASDDEDEDDDDDDVKFESKYPEDCSVSQLNTYSIRLNYKLDRTRFAYKCGVRGCDAEPMPSNHMKRHIRNVHKRIKLTVPADLKTPVETIRKAALQNVSGTTSSGQVYDDRVKCLVPSCQMIFSSLRTFERHWKITHGTRHDNPFKCFYCKKRFLSVSARTVHHESHNREKLFTCSYENCGRQFQTSASLKIHVKEIHTDYEERKFHCLDCPRRFFSKWTLNVHLISHSSEKLFTCEVCQKSFKTKGSLIIHLEAHTEEGQFTCPDCDVKYPKTNLYGHRKVHEQQKNYFCNSCTQNFPDKSTYLQHIKSPDHMNMFNQYSKDVLRTKSSSMYNDVACVPFPMPVTHGLGQFYDLVTGIPCENDDEPIFTTCEKHKKYLENKKTGAFPKLFRPCKSCALVKPFKTILFQDIKIDVKGPIDCNSSHGIYIWILEKKDESKEQGRVYLQKRYGGMFSAGFCNRNKSHLKGKDGRKMKELFADSTYNKYVIPLWACPNKDTQLVQLAETILIKMFKCKEIVSGGMNTAPGDLEKILEEQLAALQATAEDYFELC